jgi:hypothetical protein
MRDALLCKPDILDVQIKKLRAPKNLPPQVPYKLPIIGSALELAQPIQFLERAHKNVRCLYSFLSHAN